MFTDPSSKITSNQNSPSHLSGLTAAICIVKWLSKGYSEDQIVYGKFDGNRRLVSLWIEFLKDNHWIEEQDKEGKENLGFFDHNLKVTKKGKTWLRRFESAIRIN